MQTRRQSVLEGVVNTALGFGFGYAGNRYVGLSAHTSMWLTVILTIISFARGYVVRRVFNWMNQ